MPFTNEALNIEVSIIEIYPRVAVVIKYGNTSLINVPLPVSLVVVKLILLLSIYPGALFTNDVI